jgi:hypothetical protein
MHRTVTIGLLFALAHVVLAPVPGGAVAAGGWIAALARLDEALERHDVDAAERAWRDAYVGALRSRGWEGMVTVADSHLRVARAGAFRGARPPKAHAAYMAALSRAREQRSFDGVLRCTEALARLGERGMAVHGLRIAERLAADSRERDRVASLRTRLPGLLGERRAALEGVIAPTSL